ncbi:conserved hypothetical protein [Chthoniobacter flavus Ellin428]|uniref:Uncharacterized protein n=1 Tax=Chthoniobacter flavus Ellin428 TaxID=497964 RepID=B4D9J6_9BACT|nr:hypothetical protein [Chthoniobacter flavus]EDY16957.1 conserved hypothetical protein [Chthoniobacter flavus Ellin428]TCO87834.1 hypothetical protein EV701_120133 [Chthoniobacter flavus]
MRHLTESNIQSALQRGRYVEQLIRPTTINDAGVLRWLELRATDDQFTLTLHEVFDDGSPDYLDVYSFERISPDDDPMRHSFSTLEDALAFAESSYSAARDRYVNQAVIQDEYADYLRDHRNA